MSWSVKLFQYGLAFESRKAIKVQVQANFITQLVNKKLKLGNGKKKPNWVLCSDGSANQTRGRAGIILKGLKEIMVKHLLCFDFQTTNN